MQANMDGDGRPCGLVPWLVDSGKIPAKRLLEGRVYSDSQFEVIGLQGRWQESKVAGHAVSEIESRETDELVLNWLCLCLLLFQSGSQTYGPVLPICKAGFPFSVSLLGKLSPVTECLLGDSKYCWHWRLTIKSWNQRLSSGTQSKGLTFRTSMPVLGGNCAIRK